jgi:outer membrane protein, heavy metal efflux system
LHLRNGALQAQTKLRMAKEQLQLQLLMGRAVPAADFDVIDEPRRDPPLAGWDEVERLALDLRPDLQALRWDLVRSQAEIRLQLAVGKVDYKVGTEYRRQQGLQGRGDSFGFFFSVPLPVFDRNQGEIERAQMERLQIEARWRPKSATTPATHGGSTKRRARCSPTSRTTCSNSRAKSWIRWSSLTSAPMPVS